jgi:hypothetical protein
MIFTGSRAVALAAMLTVAIAGTQAHAESKYPDWSGQWKRPDGVGIGWDQTKRLGLAQQAPLTPEYQKLFEASIADQALGGQGENITTVTCITPGMPRLMTVVRPMEIITLPLVTHILLESYLPRRIYTDGRAFPDDEEPSFSGYSIGKWIDENGDGRYEVLEIETRNFKGPRVYEASGLPLHKDNQSIIKERIRLDPSNPDTLLNDITIIDNALTRPWMVTKKYVRERRKIIWYEDNCGENNSHVLIGNDTYMFSADGLLMPTRKNQSPPDLRYFNQVRR